MRFALVLALLALTAAAPAAQSATPTERGLEAYSEGRFDDAVRLLGQAVAAAPDDPEAHYLLARVLYDDRNPARDERRAGDEIEAALDLDPDNVVYLVAQLEQFRADTWNLLQEIYRARRRREIAQHLLSIDSTNAYAHEELGVQAIVDYYQYRNALKFPALEFRSEGVTIQAPGIEASTLENEQGSAGIANIEAADAGVTGDPGAALDGQFGEEIVDRFDVNELKRRGVAVTDFAPRAAASYERAVDHLRRSLASDPRRRPVYDHVVRLATLSGRYEDVLPDLAEMYVHFPEDPGMWLYTGMVNHRLGNYEAADVAFEEALGLMDDETEEAFTDLTLILPPDEWRTFRADPDGFADRYWTSRDPRFLNEVNERKTEHYARLVTAELLYRSEDLEIAGWNTERGRLHVRYGPPETDVVIEGGFGAVVEQFAERNEGFALDAVDVGMQAANRFNVWDYGDGVRFVFEDPGRNGQFRLYSPPADVFGLVTARDPSAMDFVERAQEEVRRRPERYQFRAPGRQVQLPFRVTSFKGEAGRTDLYVNYGIPVAAAPDGADTAVQEDIDVTVRTGAFLIGPARDLLVERRRTVYGLRGSQIVPFEQTRLWTSTEPLAAVPGDGYEVSLEFETASGGTSAVQRRTVDVPDFSGDGLALSDVLLAYDAQEADEAVPGRVFRDGVSVQPAPWGVFGVGDPIYMYFEAYGLGQADGRTDYEVEASLRTKDTTRGLRRLARRIFGGDGTAVSSAFEVQGDRPDDMVYLFLDATGQEPGLYTLTVTVRDRISGEEAERETDLLLE